MTQVQIFSQSGNLVGCVYSVGSKWCVQMVGKDVEKYPTLKMALSVANNHAKGY